MGDLALQPPGWELPPRGCFWLPKVPALGAACAKTRSPLRVPIPKGALKPSVTSLALCWGITSLVGLFYKSSQQPSSRRGTSHTPRHPLLAPSPLFASISWGELGQAQGAARGRVSASRGAQPGPVPVPTGICPVFNLFSGQQSES